MTCYSKLRCCTMTNLGVWELYLSCIYMYSLKLCPQKHIINALAVQIPYTKVCHDTAGLYQPWHSMATPLPPTITYRQLSTMASLARHVSGLSCVLGLIYNQYFLATAALPQLPLCSTLSPWGFLVGHTLYIFQGRVCCVSHCTE